MGAGSEGKEPNRTATLQIGERNPTASVPTFQKTVPQIERALAEAFNSRYRRLGFRAEVVRDRIHVRGVPCPLGIIAGSDDPGLGGAWG